MDRGTELKKSLMTPHFNLFSGKSMKSFDQAVLKWEKHGGGKIMKELNEDLKKQTKQKPFPFFEKERVFIVFAPSSFL
ncbi:hypothetical protein PO124_17185 [Bacillus licheniformis]|nr:hypothetical protein [Bacillus licheniformis]